MTPIEPGFFALSLLTTLIVGGFIVIIVTKIFAVWEERVFWKRYDHLATQFKEETQNDQL